MKGIIKMKTFFVGAALLALYNSSFAAQVTLLNEGINYTFNNDDPGNPMVRIEDSYIPIPETVFSTRSKTDSEGISWTLVGKVPAFNFLIPQTEFVEFGTSGGLDTYILYPALLDKAVRDKILDSRVTVNFTFTNNDSGEDYVFETEFETSSASVEVSRGDFDLHASATIFNYDQSLSNINFDVNPRIRMTLDNLNALGIRYFTGGIEDRNFSVALNQFPRFSPLADFNSNDHVGLEIRGFTVPIPTTAWLFGSALLGLYGLRKR